MSRRESKGDAWAKLKATYAKSRRPDAKPTELLASDIKTLPAVFQQRAVRDHLSAAHVRDLKAGKDRTGSLPPVVVWWSGKDWVCIDGHHRLKAYGRGATTWVPVEVFEGTPEDAIAESAARNTRDALPMSHRERMDTAWRITVLTDKSKAQTVAAANVSLGSVADMRRVRAALTARGEDAGELAGLSWWSARELHRKGTLERDEDEDGQSRRAKMIEEAASAIRKNVRPRVLANPDLLIEVFEALSPRIMREIAAMAREQIEDEEGSDDDDGEAEE